MPYIEHVGICFKISPRIYLGKMIQFDVRILFQLGRFKHQLVDDSVE